MGSLPVIRVSALRPSTSTRPSSDVTRHVVGLVGAVHRHVVDLTVTDARRRQVDVRLLEVGAGHVVDRDRVRTAERRQVQLLDAVHVHPDVAGLAQEHRLGAVRREAHLLGGRRRR